MTDDTTQNNDDAVEPSDASTTASGDATADKKATDGEETSQTEEAPQEEAKTADAEEAKVEAPKEAPKAEIKPEPAKEEPSDAKAMDGKEAKAKKPAADLPTNLAKIAKELEGLTALEMSQLAGHLEEVFGVSAMPMMAAGAVASTSASGDATADKEEKSTYDVVLTDGGANKLNVIKAVREFRQDLGLMDAKKLVESAPQTLLEGAKKEDAEVAKKKIEDAGGKVEMK